MAKRTQILLLIVGLLVAGVAVVAVLLKSTPAVYSRTAAMGADPAEAERFEAELLNKVLNPMWDRSRQTLLEIELTEEMVNAVIVKEMADQEGRGHPLPAVLKNARIGFEPGRLVLATTVGRGASAVVVSQEFRLSVGPEGTLALEPAGTFVGEMPAPDSLMDAARTKLADEIVRLEGREGQAKLLDVLHVVQEALDGQPVPLGSGKYRVALDRIELARGVLRIEGHRPK
jgi:hypothetical protein